MDIVLSLAFILKSEKKKDMFKILGIQDIRDSEYWEFGILGIRDIGNSGYWDSGYWNSGYWNSGYWEFGILAFGIWEIGNSGNWDSGNGPSGNCPISYVHELLTDDRFSLSFFSGII